VGSAAIQIAKHLGAEVIATGSTPEKRALGRSLGADHVLEAGPPNWAAEVRRLTGRRGVDLVIEHVGGAVLEQCFHCLARGGTIVTCGATIGREVKVNLWPMFVKQQRLVGSYGRNRADLEATLQAVAEGWLRPVIDRSFGLAEAAAALAALRDRRVLGKAVVLLPG
jgi:NADPH:quinone reductase-like Zn-dependent oxidoreductase